MSRRELMQRLRDCLNGYTGEVIKLVIIGGVLLWLFCQVRDLPAIYITKSDHAAQQEIIREGLNRLDGKVDNIYNFLLSREGSKRSE